MRPEVHAGGEANRYHGAATGRCGTNASADATRDNAPGANGHAFGGSVNTGRGDGDHGDGYRCSGPRRTRRSRWATAAAADTATSSHACAGDADCVGHGANA